MRKINGTHRLFMNMIQIPVFLLSVMFAFACGQQAVRPNVKASAQIIAKDSLPVNDKSNLFNDKNYLTGRIQYDKYPDFVKIEQAHTTKTDEYIRADVYTSFKNMRTAALKESVTLTIVSGARNFERQKGIWEAKWNGERIVEGKNLARDIKDPVERARLILLYSSMPSTSRHHWGTDIDINSLEDSYFLSGKGKKEYEWLTTHAAEYGFCQVYSKKGDARPYGYEEEKWHWSYMPVSSILLKNYNKSVTLDDIKEFAGSEVGKDLKVIERYVNGINGDCK